MLANRLGLLALALLPACYSLSLMQDPKPVPPGTFRANAGMAVSFEHPAPITHLGLRLGIFPNVEARAKVALLGEKGDAQSVQLGYNIELPLSIHQSLLFMPYYRYDPNLWEDKDGLFDESDLPRHKVQAFAMPVLFVQHIGRGHVFIGPDVHAGYRDGASFLALGGHVGFSIAAGRCVHFTPEFSVLTVVDGPEAPPYPVWSQPERLLILHDVIAEIGLSVSFGAAQD
jgi:hypothetical protein